MIKFWKRHETSRDGKKIPDHTAVIDSPFISSIKKKPHVLSDQEVFVEILQI